VGDQIATGHSQKATGEEGAMQSWRTWKVICKQEQPMPKHMASMYTWSVGTDGGMRGMGATTGLE
jgi:hypothetical protein